MRHGVLTVALEARKGTWHPEGEAGPRLELEAFGEAGGALQIPGPLIRVRAGTEVRVLLRNALERPLLVRGLHDRSGASADSVDLGPGEVRDLRFRVTMPGTYYYWGRTVGDRRGLARTDDSQLIGALIVDPAAAAPAQDRILLISSWVHPADTALPLGRRREVLAINGGSWPHTERLIHGVGDSVRWRVLNGSVRLHTMHLHGFYFWVESRGTSERDTVYGAGERRLAVTEFMAAGTTMSLLWVPTRPGNWLFHCHLLAHIAPQIRLPHARPGTPAGAGAHGRMGTTSHAFEGMAGLVMGIEVVPRGERVTESLAQARRTLRLFAHKRARYFGEAAGYGYVLQEGPSPPAADSIRIPGSPIVLQRGEPVDITVVNRTDEPVSVHWHGVEVESYYDGVADWSGSPGRTAPLIAPGDSFVVRFTPDRAGTFIYHTHQDESLQLSSGLYGPLVVLAPGASYDAATDLVFLVGRGGPGLEAPPLLNGSTAPGPLDWKVGATYRLRFINITPNDVEHIALLRDSTVQAWRAFAKDGADLAAQQATVRRAGVLLGPGETYDFEFTPSVAADFSLVATIRSRDRTIGTIRVPIRAR
ncbi:MAG: multicopper oxidase domain-containing protein [Gemmatimonadales bacterium]